MHIELLISNISFIGSFIVSFGLGVLVFVRRPPQGAMTNIVFFCLSMVISAWQLSYMLGTNFHDPYVSRMLFVVAVLVSIFMLILNTHLILAITGRFASQKKFFMVLYGIATGFTLFHLALPDTLLLPSEPVLYLNNFIVTGKFYVIQDTFFSFCLVYFLAQCFICYRKSDFRMRNRIKFFIIAYLFGYGVALFPAVRLYGVDVDPIFASLTGFYSIPLAYAILKYEVIDMNLLAKRSLGYALSVTSITLAILFIAYANDFIVEVLPGFPVWILPFVLAIAAVATGVFVWKKVKEADLLKFQFVDVVTHKFRTPLTSIKWSVEVLKSPSSEAAERQQAVSTIAEAHVRLFEMTNSMIGMSRTDESQYAYSYTAENIVPIVNDALATVADQARAKSITIDIMIPPEMPRIYVDLQRLRFVVEMMLGNAVIYSKPGSKVIVAAEHKKSFVHLSVSDTGIGISAEDMPHLFSRFFRGSNAATMHTEGMGIGLSVSRDIMKRQGGDIWAESAGIDKGSTFTAKIPTER